MLIDIRGVYKIYNEDTDAEVRALDGVNLRIDRGEFVAVVGQSGSGKSTLMNILGCLDIPTRGTYLIDGEDVKELDDVQLSHIRNKQIGFIFQGYNLIQALTAYENVELPLIYQNISPFKRRDMVMDAMELVVVADRYKHHPSEMSGGQQQRVAIARAIAAAPPVILADEPTGNLDTGATKEILQILKDLNAGGRTVILITHDNEIAAQAKRVIRISDGKVESDTRLS